MPISGCLVLLEVFSISHLNHSNRIINEQVMAKIRTLVKIEQGVPHLFRTCTGTGSVLEGCTGRYRSKVYRYRSPENAQRPECVFFFHFSIFFHPKPTLYFLHTSKSFPISLVTSFLFNSSFNTYLYFKKIFHEFLPNNSNMGYDPYTNQT